MINLQSCSYSNRASMDGAGGGKEEEAETPDPRSYSSSNQASLDGTDGGREEEAGTPNPHTCSSSNRASMDGTGDGKLEPSHAWHTALDENPNFVAPKIWCDLHLLRILAEGRETFFSSKWGEEISLAFVSLALGHSESRRHLRLLKRVWFLHPHPILDHFTP